jgi:hypothetical protein
MRLRFLANAPQPNHLESADAYGSFHPLLQGQPSMSGPSPLPYMSSPTTQFPYLL